MMQYTNNIIGLFEGHTGKGHVSTRVLFGITPKGYYVAIADAENNFCIPKEWPLLKSFVDGHKKYIKFKWQIPSEVIRLSISGHHECPEMDTLFYAVADYQ